MAEYWCWVCMQERVNELLKQCRRCSVRDYKRRYDALNRKGRDVIEYSQSREVSLVAYEIEQRKNGKVEPKSGCE